MPRLVKKLRNNRHIIFDSGTFDDWCVFVVESDGHRNAPHDATYFTDFLQLSKQYPGNKVYNDFVSIYNLTTKTINQKVTTLIDNIVISYTPEHQILVEQWFTVIYAGMIAEENKANMILKKRIKRLGLHQVLMLGLPPAEAAKFSTGKKWKELDTLMKAYGF